MKEAIYYSDKENAFKPRIEKVFKGHWLFCDGRTLASGTTLIGAFWTYTLAVLYDGT